ncbi:Uncharacterised protein [Escherichia coli]|uniref:Uncharacterized protein n=1 Tax=Escherichia coli TaxID=562 RepID=A0A2X1NJY7_ECOLX|nr:Uncharacterised protein [Escherichia coli]
MAEMKNLKIEVVRYNPEVVPHRIAHSMKCLMTQLPHYWMRWATSKTTWHRT